MFAVIRSGSKQYKVQEGETLDIELVEIGQLIPAPHLAVDRVHIATMSRELNNDIKIYEHFC